MTFFRNLVAVFVGVCVCIANSAGRTEAERLNGADVCFDVRRSSRGLTLVGKELGREAFMLQLLSSDLDSFDRVSYGNFRVKKLEDTLYMRYRSREEFFQIEVNPDGDIALMDSPRTYTGFDRRKTYAFKTDGVLENRGNQAFYQLITSANAFHNFGTIQAYTSHFFNNYQFNSGAMKLGELPIAVVDLMEGMPAVTDEPAFKQHVIENYGQFISKGGYDIKDGLNCREFGESIMNDLRMSGGDISVFRGSMNVAGILSGDVGRIVVVDGASNMYVNRFEKVPGDIKGTNGGVLYVPDEEKARLENLELVKETALRDRLGDTIYDRYIRIKNGELLTEYERQSYKGRYGRAWVEEAARTHRWGLKGGGNVVGAVAVVGIGAIIGSSGHHGSVSVGVGTSGNVHVRATNNRAYRDVEVEDAGRQYGQQRQAYDNWPRVVLEQSMNRAQLYTPVRNYDHLKHMGAPDPVTRARQVFSVDPVAEENRRRLYNSIRPQLIRGPDMQPFLTHMREQMWTLSVPPRDVQDVLGDRTITDALCRIRRFNDYTTPSSSGTEVLRSLQRDAEKDGRWFQRYFNPTRLEISERADRLAQPDLVERLVHEHPWITMIPVKSMFKSVRSIGAIALRRVHPAVAIAVAGYEVADIICENLINYAKGSKDAVGKGKSSGTGRGRTAPKQERIRSTPQDADRYVQGLQDKGVLSRKMQTKDGYDYFEVTQNCEHMGVRFRKGEFISRDKLHNEWELFSRMNKHKGAIESKTGTLQADSRVPGRTLETK